MALIKLTEITKDGSKIKEQPVLINPDFILGVSTGELKNDEPHIIGVSEIEAVRLIQLSAGRPVFVREGIDDIESMVAASGKLCS